MTYNATVDRIIERVIPGLPVERGVLDDLLRKRPDPQTLLTLLSDADPQTVRAAVLYLGLHGTMCECGVLALYLHHQDGGVVRLAEHCLWSIWMQAGTSRGNRQLATAIGGIRTGHYVHAIHLLGTLVLEEPGFAEAHFQHGLALCSVDRCEEGAPEYRVALRLNPYHFGAAAAMGHACIEQGNLPGALHYYRQALRIHPGIEDVPDAIREVESVIGRRRFNGS